MTNLFDPKHAQARLNAILRRLGDLMQKPNIIRAYEKPIVEMDVSDWYRNHEFALWVSQTPGLATWHIPGQNIVSSPAEIFLTVEPGFHQGEPAEAEGSEQTTAPKWVWEQIILACREALPYAVGQQILVRLENCQVED